MALIKSYRGMRPKWGKECYFSENATIVGDVTMGDECSVWFNAVVRGDVAPITIGDRTNVQDGSCIHVGEGSIVAAGALVLQNTKIPAGEIWGGVPAKYLKPVRPGQTDNAKHYVAYSKFYLEEGE